MDHSNETHQEETAVGVRVYKKYLNQEDFSPLKKVCNAIETATKTHKPKIHAHFGRASGSSQPLFLCNLCFSRVRRVVRGGLERGDEYRSVTLEATTPARCRQVSKLKDDMTVLLSPQATKHTGPLRHTLSLYLFDIDRLFPADEILGFNFSCFLPVSTNVLRSELDTNLHKLAVEPTGYLHQMSQRGF